MIFLANNDELIDSKNSMKYFNDIAEVIMFDGKHKVRDFKQFHNIILDKIKNLKDTEATNG